MFAAYVYICVYAYIYIYVNGFSNRLVNKTNVKDLERGYRKKLGKVRYGERLFLRFIGGLGKEVWLGACYRQIDSLL